MLRSLPTAALFPSPGHFIDAIATLADPPTLPQHSAMRLSPGIGKQGLYTELILILVWNVDIANRLSIADCELEHYVPCGNRIPWCLHAYLQPRACVVDWWMLKAGNLKGNPSHDIATCLYFDGALGHHSWNTDLQMKIRKWGATAWTERIVPIPNVKNILDALQNYGNPGHLISPGKNGLRRHLACRPNQHLERQLGIPS